MAEADTLKLNGTARRIRRKRAERLNRRITDAVRIAALIFLLVVLLIGAWYIAFKTSYFKVRSIRVEGASRLQAERLLRLSGLNRRMSVFSIDRESVEERLKALTLVKDVSLKEESLGRFVILLKERRPLALVFNNGRYGEVDHEGVILKIYANNPPLELPIVSGLAVGLMEPGKNVDDPQYREALDWLSVLPDTIKKDMSELCMEGEDTALFTVSGVKVFLGRSPEDFASKQDVLLSRLAELKISGNQVEYLDARFPVLVEKPILRGDRTGNQM